MRSKKTRRERKWRLKEKVLVVEVETTKTSQSKDESESTNNDSDSKNEAMICLMATSEDGRAFENLEARPKLLVIVLMKIYSSILSVV